MHGLRSPVATYWDTIFADAHLNAGTILPLGPDHEERAIYVISAKSRSAETDTARKSFWCSSRATASP